MPQQGLRSTQQSITTENRLVRVPDEKMMYLEPNETALVTFLQGLKKKSSIASPRIEHYEDDFLNSWVTLAAPLAASAGGTTVTMVDGTGVVPGDILMIPSGTAANHERMRVTAKPSDHVATVIRQIGGTPLLAAATGAGLVMLGEAYEEGSGAPIAKRTTPTLVTNFTQIFKKSANITGTDAASRQYANNGDERARQRAKIMKEYKIQMNYQFLWGVPSESLTGGPNGLPIRTTGGIYNSIVTNRMDVGGLLTQKKFETFSQTSFRYGSKRKMLLAAGNVMSAINMWARGLLRLEPSSKVYGVDVREFRTTHGTWLLANDWSLVNGVAGQPGLDGYAFSIDIDRIKMRYLEGRDTKMQLNVEPNDEDRDLDLIMGELGLQVYNEKTHGLMIGVTDYEL